MKWLQDVASPPPVDFPARAFLSMQPDPRGGYLAAYREFVPEQSNVLTKIRRQRYGEDFSLDGASTQLTTAGEDPRTFLWRDSVWTLVEMPKNGTCDCDFILIDLLTFKSLYVSHDLRFGGKNWMPVTGREELYFVRSLDPLCVLRMSESGRCETILFQGDQEIGQYRGGCNARFVGERIVGYGHRTRTRDHHEAFAFTINLDGGTCDAQLLASALPDGLVDPTSQWRDVLLTSCARENWWVPQPIVHRLFRVGSNGA